MKEMKILPIAFEIAEVLNRNVEEVFKAKQIEK
jgi:hypothetical protein